MISEIFPEFFYKPKKYFIFQESPIYETLLVLQSIAQVCVGCGFLICVNFGSVIAMLIGNQYDLLSCSLKNILHTAMYKAGQFTELRKLQNDHTFQFDDSNVYYINYEKIDSVDDELIPKSPDHNALKLDSKRQLHDKLCEALRESVLHHEIIIKAYNQLEAIMNPVISVKYTQVTILLCTLMVTILKISGPVLYSYCEYGGMATFDLAMLCYSGEIIKGESIKVGDALLRSPWHKFNVNFRQLIIIVLSNTQKALAITGGKFFDLGWDLFVTSLKLSFSCFTLLNKLGN